ncbi:transposase [Acidithiobacillus caldus]|jgi:hypothetical protein|uniref:transposase n=1 Tax=Acidithiobacillus caldus TaxID=33059 RepID=UPI001C0657CA|nr:transposase [Acidithiobacillus caldus]
MPLIGRTNCATASKNPRFLRQKPPSEPNILHPGRQVPDDLPTNRNHNSWQSRPSERTHGFRHGVSGKYLQEYLNEFVYRFNRRFWEPKLPLRLLNACMEHLPVRLVAEKD